MSDAYGTIALTLSLDFKGDIHKLRDSLNRFSWSNDNEQWDIDDEGYLFCQSGYDTTPQYPCAFPQYRFAVDVFIEGLGRHRTLNPTGEKILEALEEGEEVYSKDCNLELITQIIAPSIYIGSIEIGSIYSWRDGSFKAINLSIDAEHNAKAIVFYSGYGNDKSTEEYVYKRTKSALEEFMSEGVK